MNTTNFTDIAARYEQRFSYTEIGCGQTAWPARNKDETTMCSIWGAERESSRRTLRTMTGGELLSVSTLRKG